MDFFVINMEKLKLDHNDGIISSVILILHKLLIILLIVFIDFEPGYLVKKCSVTCLARGVHFVEKQ